MYELKKNGEVVGRYMTELDCEYALAEIENQLRREYRGEDDADSAVEEVMESYDFEWVSNEADWLLEWIDGCGKSRIQLRDIDTFTMVTFHRHDRFRIGAISIGPLYITVDTLDVGYTNDCFRINDGTVLVDVARLELVE